MLETAHPAKFREIVEETISRPDDIPERLAEYMKKEKQSVLLSARFDEVKEFLLSV